MQEQAEQVHTAHQAISVAIQPMPEFQPEAHVGANLATRTFNILRKTGATKSIVLGKRCNSHTKLWMRHANSMTWNSR